jgi:endonuclease G
VSPDATSPGAASPDAGSAPTGSGFDPAFLPFPVDLPTPRRAIQDDLAEPSTGGTVLDYEHFSLVMSRSRRLARWVAWNIDGRTRFADISRKGQKFRADPRLPASGQVLNDVYDRNRLDRGHLARRADLLWGSRAAAERANHDSFYFTNITPQMDNFNQARRDGVWGQLEIALLEVVDRQRASVIGGPVLRDDDPPYRGVQVPLEFWKLLAYEIDGKPRVRIFLVTQKLQPGVLPDPLDAFEVFTVTAAELSDRTQLSLSRPLLARVVREPSLSGELSERRPIRSASAIGW